MSCDEVLEHVPPVARYRREVLADDQNAVFYWGQAAEQLVAPGEPLLDRCLYGAVSATEGTGGPPRTLDETTVAGLRTLVERNQPAIRLLRQGVRCGHVQFPDFAEEGGSLGEHAESLSPLRDLAHAWWGLARLQIADGHYAAAATELAGLGELGHMLCCGEGFVMQYLVGCSVLDIAQSGIRLLAAEPQVAEAPREELRSAVRQWLAEAGRMTHCLRVELCRYALPELERLAACPDAVSLVDQFLERHYANAPLLSDADDEPGTGTADDGRRAWRRESLLYLLDGHPQPFALRPTVRRLGRLVADRIQELDERRRWPLIAGCQRVVRTYRLSRFLAQARLWPAQLSADFPYECLGPSDVAQHGLAELQPHVSPRLWEAMQPPTEDQLRAVRERLHWVPNALGVLIISSLLSVNIAHLEGQRRARLQATQQALADRP